MREATYTVTGELVDAAVIDRIKSSDLPRFRRDYQKHFVCPVRECGVPAWHRKRSRDGCAADFRAVHVEGCEFDGREVVQESGDLESRRSRRENLGTRSVVDVGWPRPRDAEVRVAGSESGGAVRGSMVDEDYEVQRRRDRTQGMRILLHHLVRRPEYLSERGGEEMVLPDREGPLGEVLVHLDDLDPDDERVVGQHVLVWGPVKANRTGPGRPGYFNQGYTHENSRGAVQVPSVTADRLQRELGVEYFHEFTGWYVLAYGKARRRGVGGGVLIVVDPEHRVQLRRR